jgi:o-succinylbenzoate synthase
VTIARATLTRFRLRLRTPITTARGRLCVREGALLALVTDSGVTGYGEALPLEGFGAESPAAACEMLDRLARLLLGRDPRDLDNLLDEVEAIAPDAPAARAAVDAALFDLVARVGESRVAALIAAPDAARSRVAVSALVLAAVPDAAAREARLAVSRGFGTLKIKLGAIDLDLDEARVAAVRDAVGMQVKIRLDANGGWKEAQAGEALARFAAHRIEFLEQPVEAGELCALARLRAASPIRIAADEALDGGRAVDEILERNAADFLILKPAALGGLRAARRFAARARAAGVGVAVTSALDSAVGLAAALQLAAALPGPLPAAGLATADLLAEDLAPAPVPKRGQISLPDDCGLGVTPLPAALARCAVGKAMEISA